MGTYAIMRMEKRHMGAVGKIEAHHERTKNEYKSNPDIDTSRSHLNYHLAAPQRRYRQQVLFDVASVNAKMRKDSVVLQDCLVTATPDWIRKQDPAAQAAFLNLAYDFFCEKIGTENIVSAVVHLDEATPHMHLCFVPLTKDGRLSSKEVVGGPKGLVQWQDEFYSYMHERYAELDRGIPARMSHRRHIPTFMYKAADELFAHYADIQKAIQDIGLIGNSKRKDEALALLGQYAPEMAQLSVQLHTTDRYIADMEKELGQERSLVAELQGDSEAKQQLIRQQRMEILTHKAEVANLNAKQKQLVAQIQQLPPELLAQLTREEKRRRCAPGEER